MLKRCANGHLFDNTKSSFCPHCGWNSKDFDPKYNFIPCVYGSPEQMRGTHDKKKGLLGLFLVLGVFICIVLLILILLNL